MSNKELGSFRTKAGNHCSVTLTQVLWSHTDGSFYQAFIRDIRSVTLETQGFLNREYIVHIWKVGENNSEWTVFANSNDQSAFAEAIRTAMRNYSG